MHGFFSQCECENVKQGGRLETRPSCSIPAAI